MDITKTRNDFLVWVNNARLGDRKVYHTGRLAGDREVRPDLDLVATAAWEAQRAGLVWLVQEPVDDDEGYREHDYIAIRTRKRA